MCPVIAKAGARVKPEMARYRWLLTRIGRTTGPTDFAESPSDSWQPRCPGLTKPVNKGEQAKRAVENGPQSKTENPQKLGFPSMDARVKPILWRFTPRLFCPDQLCKKQKARAELRPSGCVAEWLNAAVSKTVECSLEKRAPWVRIPPHPPSFTQSLRSDFINAVSRIVWLAHTTKLDHVQPKFLGNFRAIFVGGKKLHHSNVMLYQAARQFPRNCST